MHHLCYRVPDLAVRLV